jgi:hypothetical protein
MLRFKAADALAGVPPAATIATSFFFSSSVHIRFRTIIEPIPEHGVFSKFDDH